MPLIPSGAKVEIQFGGVYADVTADVDWNQGLQLHVGRQTKLSTPTPAEIDLRLRNPKGAYTPDLQVLTDGTAAPHWPNVEPGVLLRYSTKAGVRFVGPVQSFKPRLQGGVLCDVDVVALDVTDRLSRVRLAAAVTQEVKADSPVAFWPLTDASGPTGNSSAAEVTGGVFTDLRVVGAGAAPVFGSDGPAGAEGTAVTFAPTTEYAGKFLQADVTSQLSLSACSVEMWVRPSATTPAPWTYTLFRLFDPSMSYTGPLPWLGADETATFGGGVGGSVPGAAITDGQWHHLVCTIDATARTKFYIDGVFAGAVTNISLTIPFAVAHATVAGGPAPFVQEEPAGLVGDVGPVAVYDQVLSPTRVFAHYRAGLGWDGETVDERIARFLGYGGLSAGTAYGAGLYGAGPYGGATGLTWSLDASPVVLNSFPQAGVDVASAAQAAVDSEGGGAVLYANRGLVVFRGRGFRRPAAPTLTVDAQLDLSRDSYAPSKDLTAVINEVTVTRQSGSQQLDTVTVSDQDSIDAYGLGATTSLTSWATLTDLERPLYLAQSVVAGNARPGYAFDQVAVDLLTATHDLFAAVYATEIGSRIRVTGLPPASAPATQLDVLAEGWTETAKFDLHRVVFDTSPADNPARAVADDPVYGRAQADGLTVNTSAAAGDATVAVAAAAGKPLFTTDPAAYPLKIRIGAEKLTITAAPGATSPQTLSVSRGVDGTRAAAQPAGSIVRLEPRATAAL